MSPPDPRLLIRLSELPGLDPVGLWVYNRAGAPQGLCADAYGPTVVADGRCSILPGRGVEHLSLADAATRDRCLRWLAGRVELDVGCGAPSWAAAWVPSPPWKHRLPPHRHWVLTMYARGNGLAGPSLTFGPGTTGVPALADLDPTDDTRLPDGSRLVDALALAAVLRQVGGAT